MHHHDALRIAGCERSDLPRPFSPDYAALPAYTYGPAYLDKDREADLGFYIQEQARFFDKVTLTLGGRYYISKYDAVPGRSDDTAFTPKIGAAYEIIPGFRALRKLQPFFTDVAGLPVAREEGENWEAGLKFELLGGKLTGILSVYQRFHRQRRAAQPGL